MLIGDYDSITGLSASDKLSNGILIGPNDIDISNMSDPLYMPSHRIENSLIIQEKYPEINSPTAFLFKSNSINIEDQSYYFQDLESFS